MAAATASWDSNITNQRAQLSYLLQANTTVYAGTFAQVNSAGTYVLAGANATAYKVVGVFVRDEAPTADTVVPVREGDVLMNNSSTDPVLASDLGATVYVADSQTVRHTSTSNGKAGIFIGFDTPTGLPRVRCTLECT